MSKLLLKRALLQLFLLSIVTFPSASFAGVASESVAAGKELINGVVSGSLGDALTMIFGGWITGDPNLTDDFSMFTKIVGYASSYLLGLSVLMISYQGMGVVARSTIKGGFSKTGLSPIFLPLRLIMIVALLMPSEYYGDGTYSITNAHAIYGGILRTGSNLADRVSEKTIDLITNGEMPSGSSMYSDFSFSTSLLKNITCSVGLYENYKSRGIERPIFSYDTNDGATRDGPSLPSSNMYNQMLSYSGDITRITFGPKGPNGLCGSIDIPLGGSLLDAYGSTSVDMKMYKDGYKAAFPVLVGFLNDLLPLATSMTGTPATVNSFGSALHLGGYKNMADTVEAASVRGDDYEALQLISKMFIQSSLQFQSKLYPSIVSGMASEDKSYEEVKKQGWTALGTIYTKVGRVEEIAKDVYLGVVGVGVVTERIPSTSCGLLEMAFNILNSQCDSNLREDAGLGVELVLAQGMSQTSNWSVAPDQPLKIHNAIYSCDEYRCEVKASGTRGLTNYIVNTMFDVAGVGGVLDGTAPLSAIQTLKNIGRTAAVGNNVAMGAAILAGIGERYAPPGPDVYFEYAERGFLKIAFATFSTGSVFGYWVPMMPVVAWIIMVLGCLVFYMIGFVSFPLGVMTMLTPEGEGISGTRFERMNSLAWATLLRPTLLVLGMLASLAFSLPAMILAMKLFVLAFGEPMLKGLDIMGLLMYLAVLVFLIYSIAKMQIAIIHSFPNKVAHILGATGQEMGEQGFADDVQNSGSTASSVVNSLTNPAEGRVQGHYSDKDRERRSNKNNLQDGPSADE